MKIKDNQCNVERKKKQLKEVTSNVIGSGTSVEKKAKAKMAISGNPDQQLDQLLYDMGFSTGVTRSMFTSKRKEEVWLLWLLLGSTAEIGIEDKRMANDFF